MKYANLEKIYKASLKFLSSLTVNETYATIVDEAIKLINAEYGSIILCQNEELVRVYSSSPIAFQTKNRKRGNTYKAFSTSKTIISDISETIKAHSELKKTNIQWTIFIPLSYQKKSIGVLTINVKNGIKPTEKDVSILELFGSMASLAILKTQLYYETKRALELRDLFVSMAAHELRTPVTTVYGYSQLLRTKFKDRESQEGRWIDELHTESWRLSLLVNDLLEISRIRTGKVKFVWKECGLVEVCDRAINNFQFNHPKRTLIVNNTLSKGEDTIVGDFDKLLQIVTNLLDNAAKFSSIDQEILLIFKRVTDDFVITVKDKGIGIAKKDLKRIFNEYYKGRDNLKEGMGLGLYLVRSYVNQHHGKIQVKSSPNRGTIISIILPSIRYEKRD